MVPYLRLFTADDWRVFKSIRLEALHTDQYYFGGRYENESVRTDEEWIERLNPDAHRAMWGLYDGDECIGLTGIVERHDNPEAALMVASFIRPQYRRRGLSALYYEARIAWATEHGYKEIHVAHRHDNHASKAANQKFGFKYTHTENILWPDGIHNDEFCYQLIL